MQQMLILNKIVYKSETYNMYMDYFIILEMLKKKSSYNKT